MSESSVQWQRKRSKKKPARTPPLPVENKFVDRTKKGKECICLSCNQIISAQRGSNDTKIRWPNLIRSHFTGVQEVEGVEVPLCSNAHADIVALCTSRRLLRLHSRGNRNNIGKDDDDSRLSSPENDTEKIVTVATTQFSCSPHAHDNIAHAEVLVRDAAGKGANIVLLQELFQGAAHPSQETLSGSFFNNAIEGGYLQESPIPSQFCNLARELSVVLPITFLEREGVKYYKSVAVIDSDGIILGVYRMSHVSDEEKWYLTPGDSGFKVFKTRYAKIGIGIGSDQWYPEAARAMVLQGAEILFYPTCFGSIFSENALTYIGHWHRTLVGHSAANCVPVVVANRTGQEARHNICDDEDECGMDKHTRSNTPTLKYHGSSFITSALGEISIKNLATQSREAVLVAELDLALAYRERRMLGCITDRRPDLYENLLTNSFSEV